MNFASKPRRAPAPDQPIAAPLNREPIPAARLANSLPFASKPLSTASESGEGRYPLFSYSCKRLYPQPLSFDTHTNAPGVAYPLALSLPPVRARYIVLSSPGDQLNWPKSCHSARLPHPHPRSFALLPKSEMHLLRLHRLAHFCPKTPGCTLNRCPRDTTCARHKFPAPT